MCGIAGSFGFHADANSPNEAIVSRLRHRGPDDEGVWASSGEPPVQLMQTRLAILDLSAAGHQPMTLEASHRKDGLGNLRIVFNGEIYNFRELRRELAAEGREFRTETDTEVILHLYDRDGERCVEKLRGMFALAIWDEGRRIGFLARDPLGIKPLYLVRRGGEVLFASEVRALLATKTTANAVCPEAVWSYFRTGSISAPRSLLRGIESLAAGSWLRWSEGQIKEEKYWHPQFGNTPAHDQGPSEAAQTVRGALLSSMEAHLVSDVPVGVFLSGGIDSTSIAILARKAGLANLRTYSIAFHEEAYDESDLCRRTAEALGADHHVWRISAEEGGDLIGDFVQSIDQPSCDGFNTFCVSKFARESGSKVVLSGLGGDELFAGYPTFDRVGKLLQLRQSIPGGFLRRSLGNGLGALNHPKAQRLGEFLAGPGTVTSAYETCRSLFTEAQATKLTQWFCGTSPSQSKHRLKDDELVQGATLRDQVSWLEISRYMRNQLLRDSDVMSMCWGLELRVPFVDRVLFETVSKIPASLRLRAGKAILREAVPELPEWVLNQPKRGFSFPFAEWMNGSWKQRMSEALADCPVPTPQWYQKWACFVLKEWCARNL